MKNPPNLNEEIAAMAKSDSSHTSELSTDNSRHRDEERQSNPMAKPNASDSKKKKRKCRKKLVREIRISVSTIYGAFKFKNNQIQETINKYNNKIDLIQ